VNARVDSFAATLAAADAGAGEREIRRAALLLHTVADADRAWLLERLDDAARARLSALVDELRALGIPRSPELLDELGPPARAQPAGLHGADPALLARVLGPEPAALVARVVALGPWPWTGELLARLGAAQRRRVMDALDARLPAAPGAPTTALDARLLALLERRVADAAAEGAVVPAEAGERAGMNGRPARWWLRRNTRS
jgi:hypothetical protein